MSLFEPLAVTAFLAGLLGGVHCAAMCGGIVGAVCRAPNAAAPGWGRLLGYNAGRIASYVLAGALAGAMGAGALSLRGGAAAQQTALAFAGSALVLLALYMAGVPPLVRAIEKAGSVLWRRVQPFSRWFLPADTPLRALGLGAVWGWLPCGMVYAVLLTAATTGSALQGGMVMAAFGAGTLPNMLALSVLATRLHDWGRKRAARRVAAALIAGIGIFGILHAMHPPAAAANESICTAGEQSAR